MNKTTKTLPIYMARSAVILLLFTIAGTGLVALTFNQTKGKIAQAERDALLKSLHAVIDPHEHDNDLFTDLILVESLELLGSPNPTPAFRARKAGQPVAVILSPIAPNGYNGAIKLLVGIRVNGEISGVRVVSHRETPGLGDAIEDRRSNWITRFTGLSLDNPEQRGWRVKRDGGQFDQFTGATITPRAVVQAVHKALQYFQENKSHLFAPSVLQPTPKTTKETPS